MRATNATIALVVVLEALTWSNARALGPGESVALDPAAGDYVVTYVGEGGSALRSVFHPATKTRPFLIASFEPRDGLIRYEYSPINDSTARQAVVAFQLDYVNNIQARREVERRLQEVAGDEEGLDRLRACIEATTRPGGWKTTCSPTLRSPPPGAQINWFDLSEGVPIGGRVTGFGYSSRELPGMTSARFRGKSFPDWSGGGNPDPGDFGEWTISDDLRDRLAELSRLDMDGVARWTSTAVLEVSDPFSPVFVLEHLRLHADPWVGQGLMAQDLWARVDGLLGGALSDFEKGDTGNGIVKLAQIRVELRKAFPDLDLTTKYDDPKPEEIPAGSSAYQTFLQVHDRRLTAKVLDFDVGYTIGATGAGMFPAPADGTILAPPIDADGTFSVSWGRPVSRVQTVCGVLSTGCKDAILGYVLESATVPTFTNAEVVYAGSAQQFKANQFTAGPHFFRVKARMLRCQGPSLLSWEQWTCSANEPGAVEAETGYYAIGPNVTIVTPR